MTWSIPTVIAIYDLGTDEPQKVAEFRLAATGMAELAVFDSHGCPVAERWYQRGIADRELGRRIRPVDGPRFMLALLQPTGLGYYRVVDESEYAESADTGQLEVPHSNASIPGRQGMNTGQVEKTRENRAE
ncbi:hypothetical protein ACWCPQ_19280 [Nocardia sp. NPDC001965]